MTPTLNATDHAMAESIYAALNKLATRAMGLTGADIERIVRQARKKNELIPSSSTERNRMPSFGRPMMTKTKMISSGVLRTTVM